MGARYSYRLLGAGRRLEGSANVWTRLAMRSRSGIGQDPIGYRDLLPPEQCVEPSGRREHTPASIDHRTLDWPSVGSRRTAYPADLAGELVLAWSADVLLGLDQFLVVLVGLRFGRLDF